MRFVGAAVEETDFGSSLTLTVTSEATERGEEPLDTSSGLILARLGSGSDWPDPSVLRFLDELVFVDLGDSRPIAAQVICNISSGHFPPS